MVLGVAGKFCSGKSALADFLGSRGFAQIDVDRLGHEALRQPAVRARVVQRFGREILGPGGEIDRGALGGIVFRSRLQLRQLERIVHPWMIARVEELLAHRQGPVILDAAILFRMGLERLCDFVICVRAPLRQRVRRAQERDGLSLGQALRRAARQRGICPKKSASEVDTYYVVNDRRLPALEAQVLTILRQRGIEVR